MAREGAAGQALAGITATWTRSTPTRQVTVTQYSAVYQGISARDVIKQARAVSTCHRDVEVAYEPGHQATDEYFVVPSAPGAFTFRGVNPDVALPAAVRGR